MPIEYSFTTGTGEARCRVPTARARLDRVTDLAAPAGIYIANRIPSPIIAAQLETAYTEPYALADQIDLEFHVLSKASIEIGDLPFPPPLDHEPFDIINGDTLEIRVDWGYVQYIVLDGVTDHAATAEQLARSLASQLRQAEVELKSTGQHVIIRSRRVGAISALQFVGGTLVTKLGLLTTVVYGADTLEHITFSSADFVDIEAATAEEVTAAINSVILRGVASLSSEDSRVRLSAPDWPELYCRGEAATRLGLLSWAELTGSISEPFALHEGATLKLKVDGGAEQTVTFRSNPLADIEYTSAEYITQALNSNLLGATASALTDTKIRIRSNTESALSGLEITGGDAPSILGLSTAPVYGVGRGVEEWCVAEAADPIQFDVVNTKSGTITDVRIQVITDHEAWLVYSKSLGYTEPGWTIDVVENPSPGEVDPDNIRYIARHTNPFISEEIVRVNLYAKNSADDTVEVTHRFTVEDTRNPWVVSITPWTPKSLRVKFSEPMDQVTNGPASSLYTRDVSGQVRYYAPTAVGELVTPSKIEAPNTIFTTDDIGLFIGSAGARNAANNCITEIIGICQDGDGNYTQAEVDVTLVNESPPAAGDTDPPPRVVVSPYRVQRHTSLADTTPAYLPIVLDALPITAVDVAVGDEPGRYVELALHDDLTPSVPYFLEVVKISDPSGNVIGSTHEFNSWNLRNVLNRSWNLCDELPQRNWDQDTSGDLLRFMNCLNEVAQILLNDVDTIADLFDPWSVKDNALDHLLGHLGNPFTFTDSLVNSKKRQLAALLPYMYKCKGTTLSIEDSVLFFIGKSVSVVSWQSNDDVWIIGESELGIESYLDPSKSYIRYAFTIEHDVLLTDEEKAIIAEIVHFARTAHTHFLGYEYTG